MQEESSELEELSKMVLTQCQMKDLKIAVVESATGGFLSHNLTNIPGCSKVFVGGMVAYSANIKNYTMNVDFDIINECGTISPETTEALLEGLNRVMVGADIGIAITGIAGTKILEGKPRGLMYIGISIGNMCKKVRKYQFTGTRQEIKEATVKAAFEFLLEQLEII